MPGRGRVAAAHRDAAAVSSGAIERGPYLMRAAASVPSHDLELGQHEQHEREGRGRRRRDRPQAAGAVEALLHGSR